MSRTRIAWVLPDGRRALVAPLGALLVLGCGLKSDPEPADAGEQDAGSTAADGGGDAPLPTPEAGSADASTDGRAATTEGGAVADGGRDATLPTPDAGFADASTDAHATLVDGGTDAHVSDASPPQDAASDSGSDSGPPPEDSGTPDAGDAGAAEVIALALGYTHACALMADRTVECWGDNTSGQLGTGVNVGDAGILPVHVPGLRGVTALSEGSLASHQCAAIGDGGVACWGANGSGQVLGYTFDDGGSVWTPAFPFEFPAPLGTIATDQIQTCGVTSNGSGVSCWGYEPGSGSQSPAPVSPLSTTVSSIAIGNWSCVVTTDAGVGCWNTGSDLAPWAAMSGATQLGLGGFGQCGVFAGTVKCLGATPPDGGPAPLTPVGNLPTDITQVVVSWANACALRAQGEVWCWGTYYGAGTDAILEQKLKSYGPATSLYGGGEFQCAIVGGAPYCWGWDDTGQLGDGQRTPGYTWYDVVKVQL